MQLRVLLRAQTQWPPATPGRHVKVGRCAAAVPLQPAPLTAVPPTAASHGVAAVVDQAQQGATGGSRVLAHKRAQWLAGEARQAVVVAPAAGPSRVHAAAAVAHAGQNKGLPAAPRACAPRCPLPYPSRPAAACPQETTSRHGGGGGVAAAAAAAPACTRVRVRMGPSGPRSCPQCPARDAACTPGGLC